MPQFLTTSGTAYYVEQIIIAAKGSVVLLSPYLKLSKTLLERLRDASKRGVKIFIVYSQSQLSQADSDALGTIKTLRLFSFRNLHAKCYFNETHMIITSMNIYEFSEKNNREMGVLINREEDAELFENAYREVSSILSSAKLCNALGQPMSAESPVNAATKFSGTESALEKSGHCIRCHAEIPYNPNRPLCGKCYASWAKYKNYSHPEKYCHQCGQEAQSTLRIPRCKPCFMSV